MQTQQHDIEGATLVILSPGFPSDESDTTCLPPIQQFCLLAKEEYPALEIVVIAFQYPFRRDTYKWNGIEVFAIGGKNRDKLFRLFTWMKVKRVLRKLHREKKLKGILALWLTETALIGRSFAKSKGIKFYTWLQGQDAKKENGYVFRSGVKSSEVIAISEFNAQEFKSNHKITPFMVASNGVNDKAFSELNTGEREIDVVGVGSLVRNKNFEAFVRAIHALKKKFPHIRAVIAGSGEEERNLIDLITQLGLNHQLKLVGSLPHSQVLDLMNRSKILLHTSKYEGMSTVTLEALFSGCRVVSFQGIGGLTVRNLTIVQSEEELTLICIRILSDAQKFERTLVYNMRDTVRKIIGLYS